MFCLSLVFYTVVTIVSLIEIFMMTSSNENIFRVTGHLCGEFTGPGEFPTQKPVTRSFDVYFDLRPNKWLSKQSWGWWFETLSCSLWRHRNDRNAIHVANTWNNYVVSSTNVNEFQLLCWVSTYHLWSHTSKLWMIINDDKCVCVCIYSLYDIDNEYAEKCFICFRKRGMIVLWKLYILHWSC